MKSSALFCLCFLLAACAPDDGPTTEHAAARSGSSAAADAARAAGSASAHDPNATGAGRDVVAADLRSDDGAANPRSQILLDLRLQPLEPLPEGEDARELVEQVFGGGAPANASVVGFASGSFTAPDLEQQVVVLARPMVTARPAPPQGMISVLQDGRAIADFVPDTGYHALAGTADINEDGSDELLLRVDSMQMGIVSSAIHVLSLSGGSLRVIERFENAAQDSCDNPVGDRGRLAAVLLRGDDGGIIQKEYRADCGDGAYRPVP